MSVFLVANSIFPSHSTHLPKFTQNLGVIFIHTCYAEILKFYYTDSPLDTQELAKRFWGDVYFKSENKTFTRKPETGDSERTFVLFILNPLYKIFSQVSSFK
jgi:hypothetical protein